MRMMKRVAVSILAAAMALSLMTACGGGDAPSAPETPSNPGTRRAKKKKDDARKTRPQRASRKIRKTKKWQMARRSNSTRAALISGCRNMGLQKKYTSRWNR